MNRTLLKFKTECCWMSCDHSVFRGMELVDENEVKPYSPRSGLEKGEWFYICDVSQKDYFDTILIEDDTVEYPYFDRQKLSDCKFILDYQDGCLCVQNITRYRILKKRLIGNRGEISDPGAKLVLNDEPDFIYDSINDKLFFKKLSAVKSLLPGIIEEYREATEEEVETFVKMMDIRMIEGYTQKDIKIRNRKLIALVSSTIGDLSDTEKQHLLKYVQKYCPQYIIDSKFTVKSDKEFNELLYALDERYYETPVTRVTRKALTVDGDIKSD